MIFFSITFFYIIINKIKLISLIKKLNHVSFVVEQKIKNQCKSTTKIKTIKKKLQIKMINHLESLIGFQQMIIKIYIMSSINSQRVN